MTTLMYDGATHISKKGIQTKYEMNGALKDAVRSFMIRNIFERYGFDALQSQFEKLPWLLPEEKADDDDSKKSKASKASDGDVDMDDVEPPAAAAGAKGRKSAGAKSDGKEEKQDLNPFFMFGDDFAKWLNAFKLIFMNWDPSKPVDIAKFMYNETMFPQFRSADDFLYGTLAALSMLVPKDKAEIDEFAGAASPAKISVVYEFLSQCGMLPKLWGVIFLCDAEDGTPTLSEFSS